MLKFLLFFIENSIFSHFKPRGDNRGNRGNPIVGTIDEMFKAFDVHDSEMDTLLKSFLWKKNLTAPNHKIFYIYGGAILVFKGIFFQHPYQNICPPPVF
jgi:hypothetical protein